jgi:hypothetical protein
MINALSSLYTYSVPNPAADAARMEQAVVGIRTDNAERVQPKHVAAASESMGPEVDSRQQILADHEAKAQQQAEAEAAATRAQVRARTVRSQREVVNFFLNAVANVSLPAEETRDNPQNRSIAVSVRGYQRSGSTGAIGTLSRTV